MRLSRLTPLALLMGDDGRLGGLRVIACCQSLDFNPRRRDQNDLAIDDRCDGITGAFVVTERFAHRLLCRAYQRRHIEAKFTVPSLSGFPFNGLGGYLSHWVPTTDPGYHYWST